jgi:hypothetical protein
MKTGTEAAGCLLPDSRLSRLCEPPPEEAEQRSYESSLSSLSTDSDTDSRYGVEDLGGRLEPSPHVDASGHEGNPRKKRKKKKKKKKTRPECEEGDQEVKNRKLSQVQGSKRRKREKRKKLSHTDGGAQASSGVALRQVLGTTTVETEADPMTFRRSATAWTGLNDTDLDHSPPQIRELRSTMTYIEYSGP